jgi:hypothetical protein
LIGYQPKTIDFRTPNLELVPTFPCTHFSQVDETPSVTIAANSKVRKTAAAEHIHLAIITGSEVTGEWLAAFLYQHALTFKKVKLDQEWQSYGVIIGRADEEIGPMDLLKKEDGPALAAAVATTNAKWSDLFYRVVMTHRMKKARESADPTYVNNLNTKLTVLGRSCIWKVGITGPIDTSRLDGALEDANVKAILAALDMFLYRFDQHELSFLRAGTGNVHFFIYLASMGTSFSMDEKYAAKMSHSL